MTLLIAILFAGVIPAQKVEKTMTEKIAKNIYKRNNQGKETNLKEVIILGDKNKQDTLFYIVRAKYKDEILVGKRLIKK